MISNDCLNVISINNNNKQIINMQYKRLIYIKKTSIIGKKILELWKPNIEIFGKIYHILGINNKNNISTKFIIIPIFFIENTAYYSSWFLSNIFNNHFLNIS